MDNETPEFETPSASSKDMWLFLIVLDVIILCVLGFFLYNHFSARVLNPVPKQDAVPALVETTERVEVVSGPNDPDPQVVAAKYMEGMDAFNREDWETAKNIWLEGQQLDPTNPDFKIALAKVEELLTQPKQMVTAPEEKQMTTVPAASVEPEPTAIETASETKQSIVVLPAANGSKYRRVTFRWFEPAETVSIVSGFTNRKPQALKKVGDYWETTLSIAPGTYKFLYIIDGTNTLDPYADQKDGRSVLVVK